MSHPISDSTADTNESSTMLADLATQETLASTPEALVRLAGRYLELGHPKEAEQVIERLETGSRSRADLESRLTSAEPSLRHEQPLVPSRTALTDAYRFAVGTSGWIAALVTVALAWLPFAVLGAVADLGSLATLRLALFAVVHTVMFGYLVESTRTAKNLDFKTLSWTHLKSAIVSSLRRNGPCFAALFLPALMVGLVQFFAGAVVGLIAVTIYAAALPSLVVDPRLELLDPRLFGEHRRFAGEDFALMLSVGALLTCAILLATVSFSMGAIAALVGTLTISITSTALIRLAETTRRRQQPRYSASS